VDGGASVYHDAARNTLPLPGAINLVVVDSLQQAVAQGRAQLSDYLVTGAYVVPLAWLQQLREGTAAAAAAGCGGGSGASSSRRGSRAAVPPRLTLPEAAWQQIGSWRLFASGEGRRCLLLCVHWLAVALAHPACRVVCVLPPVTD
jgi:hypothetical protein